MKNIFLTIVSMLFAFSMLAQNQIIKVDFENGSFKNFPKLPYGEAFIVEGEVLTNIKMVEVQIAYHDEERALNTYHWVRGPKNTSENFELMVSDPLKSNTSYDFEINTYTKMSAAAKQDLEMQLTRRVIFYLKNQIVIDGNEVSIDKSKKVIEGLNTLIEDALDYQRSMNGISFEGLSPLVEDEIARLDEMKLKKLFRKKKGLEKDSLSNKLLDRKLLYLSDIIMSEVQPFLHSDLVQQNTSMTVQAVETKRERFTLPVNGGLYVWNTNTNINDVKVSNTSITPGVGLTIPFKRDLQIRDRNIGSLGVSLGILTQPITNANDQELVTPAVKLPVYGGLGIKLFDVVRLNAGTLIVSEPGNSSVNDLRFYPTFGATFELNLWLGVKK